MKPERDHLVEDAGGGKGEQTRHLLVEAALALFAEHGFQGTHIRDIAAAAGTNVGAVNYHFGSKDQLYRSVFRQLAARWNADTLRAVRAVMEASGGKPSVEAVLGATALAWERPPEGSKTPDLSRLIDREMVEPRVGPHFLFERFLEPVERELGKALKVACPKATARSIQVCIHLFLAQLSHFKRVQLHLAELGADRVALLDPDQAIHLIVRFSSAGLRALAEEDATSAMTRAEDL